MFYFYLRMKIQSTYRINSDVLVWVNIFRFLVTEAALCILKYSALNCYYMYIKGYFFKQVFLRTISIFVIVKLFSYPYQRYQNKLRICKHRMGVFIKQTYCFACYVLVGPEFSVCFLKIKTWSYSENTWRDLHDSFSLFNL